MKAIFKTIEQSAGINNTKSIWMERNYEKLENMWMSYYYLHEENELRYFNQKKIKIDFDFDDANYLECYLNAIVSRKFEFLNYLTSQFDKDLINQKNSQAIHIKILEIIVRFNKKNVSTQRVFDFWFEALLEKNVEFNPSFLASRSIYQISDKAFQKFTQETTRNKEIFDNLLLNENEEVYTSAIEKMPGWYQPNNALNNLREIVHLVKIQYGGIDSINSYVVGHAGLASNLGKIENLVLQKMGADIMERKKVSFVKTL